MGATKELYGQMQDQLMQQVADYENGRVGVLDAFTSLREARTELEMGLEIIKSFEAQYYDEIAQEAKDQDGQYNGWSIEVRAGRKIYDFSGIEEIKIAEANVKELKDYYKKAFEAHQKNILMADQDGQEIDLPEIKYGSSYIVAKREY